MSENSHDYQVQTDVPVEQVTTTDAANAFDEKLIENQNAQHPNANDIENAQQTEETAASEPAAQQDDKFAAKFAKLSRREKDIRSRERELEDRLAQFEAKMAELEANKPTEPAKEPELPLEYRLKKNPLKTLEEIGYSYEDLTKMVLNDGEMSSDMQLNLMREEIERDYRTKFEELENKLAEKEKKEEEAEYDKVLNSFKSQINDVINNSDDYDLIQANDAHDLVYDVIESYYQENGSVLDTKEAADQVEQYLYEEHMKILEKSKKLGNWRADASERVAKTAGQSPTLSNSHSVQGTQNEPQKMLSREESIAQLANQIRWND